MLNEHVQKSHFLKENAASQITLFFLGVQPSKQEVIQAVAIVKNMD
ncbi:hypothetical protein [Bacillus marinisedimentorum]|nr:hypothetical protein [Bacillus marinisedimentorum]